MKKIILDNRFGYPIGLYASTRHTTITEIARRNGEIAAIKTSGHQTDKAFERYCRLQDHTALDMAKFRADMVSGGGEVIELGQRRRRR